MDRVLWRQWKAVSHGTHHSSLCFLASSVALKPLGILIMAVHRWSWLNTKNICWILFPFLSPIVLISFLMLSDFFSIQFSCIVLIPLKFFLRKSCLKQAMTQFLSNPVASQNLLYVSFLLIWYCWPVSPPWSCPLCFLFFPLFFVLPFFHASNTYVLPR